VAVCGLIDADHLGIPVQGRALIVTIECIASHEEAFAYPVARPQVDKVHPILGVVGEGMHCLAVACEQALGCKAVPSELVVGEDIAEIDIRGVLLPAELAQELPDTVSPKPSLKRAPSR
jgi:hypothetical protein